MENIQVLWSDGNLIMQMLASENPKIRSFAMNLQKEDRVDRMVKTAKECGIVEELKQALHEEA